MFDSMQVRHPRAFVAREDGLRFKAAGKLFRVDDLPSADVVAYRLAGRRPTRLTPTVEQTPSSATLSSASGLAPTYRAYLRGRVDRAKDYALSSVEGLRRPRLESEVFSDVIRGGRAEFLVISHGDFAGELGDLVALREPEGWDVRVGDLAEVYREFSFGVVDPVAIQKYIRFAARRMGTRMVLLVGGDSYDYHDYLGLGSISFLPSLYVQTSDTTNPELIDVLLGWTLLGDPATVVRP